MAEDWDDYASSYEADFEDVTSFFTPHFVEWVNPAPHDVVVDVGCGPGVVSMALAERGAHVIGVDVSEAMLQRLGERATEAGVGERVEGVLASGEALGLPDNSAGACVSSFGIIYCPDVDAAVREMARVTTSGGALMLTAWTTEANNGWNSLLPEGYESTLGFRVPPRSNLRWSSIDKLRAALEKAQWNDVQVDTLVSKPSRFPSPEDVRKAFDTPPSRATTASLSPDQFEALKDYVVACARERYSDGEVELPREAWVARGRA